MTRVGVTGHQSIPPTAVNYITKQVREILASQAEPLVGLSSLARGADQVFADICLELGAELHAIIPSAEYGSTFKPTARLMYEGLLVAASEVHQLDFAKPTEEAFLAAGYYIAEHTDLLIAIWDGEPARGIGGTADVVAYAKSLSLETRIIWPRGVIRD
jgi:hypothetical protein